jgi:hypothetical protein
VSPHRRDFISDHRADFDVKRICQVLGVSRFGCCRHQATTQARAARQFEQAAAVAGIRGIHAGHRGVYGGPRIHAELRSRGRKTNRKCVTRLMRIHRIAGRHLRRTKRAGRTTIADKTATPAPDLVMRDFIAKTLNTRVVRRHHVCRRRLGAAVSGHRHRLTAVPWPSRSSRA